MPVEPVDLRAIQLMSTRAAARLLGIAAPAAATLLAAEVAGPAYTDGKVLTSLAEDIERLAGRDLANTEVPALQVKVSPAVYSPPEERWVGWHRRLTEQQLEEGTRMWWFAREPERLLDCALVATVAGFVVRVRRIEDLTIGKNGKVAFVTSQPTSDHKLAYEGLRIPTEQGPLTKRHGGA